METQVAKKVTDFFRKYKCKKHHKGELIIDPANLPSGIFYLEQGAVREYAISANGDILTINTFKSPALFPIGWVINGTPPKHYYETMDAVTIWIAPKKESLLFLRNNPEVVFDLMQRIYKGLEGYFDRTEKLMTGSARIRLLTNILIHFRRFGESGLNINEQELASQSGISRETVSRQLQQLKSEGLVLLHKGIFTIPDVHKLEEELMIDHG